MSRALSPLRLGDALIKPLAAWIRGVNRRRMLAEMPDYLLRDMGIRRDQIASLGDDAAIHGEAAADPTAARPTAEVIAIAPARPSTKPERPEKPIAA